MTLFDDVKLSKNIKNVKIVKISKISKMSRKMQKIQKMLIILDDPQTSKTKCKKNASIDFENGVIVKIYKS